MSEWMQQPGSGMYTLDDESQRRMPGLLGGLGTNDQLLALGLLGVGMMGGNTGRTRHEAAANALQGGMQAGLGGLNMANQNSLRRQQLGHDERRVKNMEETSAMQRAQIEEQINARNAYMAQIPGLLAAMQSPGGPPQAGAVGPQSVPAPVDMDEVARLGGQGGPPMMGQPQPGGMPGAAGGLAPGMNLRGGPQPLINPQFAPLAAMAMARGPEGLGNITELARLSQPDAPTQVDQGSTIALIDKAGRVLAVVPKSPTPGESARLGWDKEQHDSLSANQRNTILMDRWKATMDATARSGQLGVEQGRLALNTPTGMNFRGGGFSVPPMPPVVGMGGPPQPAMGQPAPMGAPQQSPPMAPPGAPMGAQPMAPAGGMAPRPVVAQQPQQSPLRGAPQQRLQIPLGVSPDDYSKSMAQSETKFQSGMGTRADEVIAASDKASDTIGYIGAFRAAHAQLLKNGGDVGALANLQTSVTSMAQAFGVDPSKLGLPKDAGPFQMMDAITAKMAVSMIGPGGMPANNFSNADREMVLSAMARKTDTPEGLRLKMDMIERAAMRTREAERFLLDGRAQGKTLEAIRSDWSKHVDATPLFPKQPQILDGAKPGAGASGGWSIKRAN